MRCWFSMGKQYGREPHKRLPTASSRRLEVCWMALDRRASPSRTSTWRSGTPRGANAVCRLSWGQELKGQIVPDGKI